jgi:hypothetical protein
MGRIYRREECVRQEEGPCGFVTTVCNLCGGSSLEAGELIEHEPDCLFADPDVLAFQGVTMTTPRSDICGKSRTDLWAECPNRVLGLCPADEWRGHTHEDLLAMCQRYAIQDLKTDRSE